MVYTLYNTLIGLGRGGYVTLIVGVQTIVQSVASIALALAGFGAVAPIAGLVIGYVAGILFSLYAIVFVARIKLVMPSLVAVKKLLKFSLPVAASSTLQTMIGSLVLIVLGAFATTVVVGNYSIASKVGILIGVVTQSIVTSLLPAFSTTIAAKRGKEGLSKLYNYSVHISLVLVTPLLLTIALLAKPVIYTAFGGGYPLAPAYTSVVSIGVLIGIIGVYASTLLISGNRIKELLVNNVALAAIQIVALFLLVPFFGGMGLVVLMFIITPIVSVLLFTRESEKSLGVHLNTWKI
jgi:O-antigen/teichoic acid export membrane protein